MGAVRSAPRPARRGLQREARADEVARREHALAVLDAAPARVGRRRRAVPLDVSEGRRRWCAGASADGRARARRSRP